MQFEILPRDYQSKLNDIKFNANNVDISILNSLRRVMLSEIENVAARANSIDGLLNDIKIIENVTPLNNEFVQNRISMIPICLSEKEIEEFDSNRYVFEINKTNTTNDFLDVTSDDINVYIDGNLQSTEYRDSVFPRSKITNDPIIINVLHPNRYNNALGDKLHVQFRARKGIAQEHACFSPVSACTYFNIVDDNLAHNMFEEMFNLHLRQKQEKSEPFDADELRAQLLKQFNTKDRFRHFKKNQYGEVNSVQFTIESECKMSPTYIFNKALEKLIFKLTNIVESERYTISKIHESDPKAYVIKLKNEQHTIGNLIQALFYNFYIREQQLLKYVGYFLVHPLLWEIVIKLTFVEDKTEKEVDVFFYQGIQNIIRELTEIQNAWNSAIHSHVHNV